MVKMGIENEWTYEMYVSYLRKGYRKTDYQKNREYYKKYQKEYLQILKNKIRKYLKIKGV